LERLVFIAQQFVAAQGGAKVLCLILRTHRHKLRGIMIRERPQQHSAGHGEDGGVGADSESECENRRCGKSQILDQETGGKTQVAKQGLHLGIIGREK
jgi:hypothetical protein